MRVLEEVVDPDCVDRGRSPLDSVDLVAFLEEEFGEVGAVLDGKEMVSAGANGRSRKHECVLKTVRTCPVTPVMSARFASSIA